MESMQCPFCGSEGIAEDVVFCPHCRYQFRQPEPGPVSVAHEETFPAEPGNRSPERETFAPGEVRLLEVMVLQPAVLLMIFIATALYLTIGQIPGLVMNVSGAEVRYGGVLCFIAGAFVAWVFYRVILLRIR